MRGELGEVLGCGVRVDDATARQAGESDVGQSSERHPVDNERHLLEGGERGVQARPVVRSYSGHFARTQAFGRLPSRDTRRSLAVLVERHQRHDRQRGHAADRLDRG
jgi:hypothetical protein